VVEQCAANLAWPSAAANIARVGNRRENWLTRWRARHRSRASRWLHALGIPLALAGLLLAGYQLALWRWDLWWRPAALMVLGYLLQYLGHRHEGNDMGEVILLKRLLGRPYVAVSRRYGASDRSAEDA